jgi:hypothetical protein
LLYNDKNDGACFFEGAFCLVAILRFAGFVRFAGEGVAAFTRGGGGGVVALEAGREAGPEALPTPGKHTPTTNEARKSPVYRNVGLINGFVPFIKHPDLRNRANRVRVQDTPLW